MTADYLECTRAAAQREAFCGQTVERGIVVKSTLRPRNCSHSRDLLCGMSQHRLVGLTGMLRRKKINDAAA